ncbi:MAG TPA: hypothetical protein VGI06_17520 [Acidimicrobiales bacterium]|jgi:predicted amidophosphoribosyltransferase
MAYRCPVCDLVLPAGRPCPNYWCRREDRGFDVVWAIAAHQGGLRRAIAGLKYRGELRWARPLGLLLARFLMEHSPWFDDVDLIVGAPGNVGRARPVDHTRRILGAAEPVVGGLWAMDVARPVLVKRAETRPMVDTPSAALRRLWAAVELRAALVVTDCRAVQGRRVLAVDDVFTDGSTLREVALALLGAGAVSVSGLVLARQPIGGSGARA